MDLKTLVFRRASSRRTEAYYIRLGEVEAFVSYNTVVAVRTPKGCGRRPNEWGVTTGRHMREMGVYDWPIMNEEELAELCQPNQKAAESRQEDAQ